MNSVVEPEITEGIIPVAFNLNSVLSELISWMKYFLVGLEPNLCL